MVKFNDQQLQAIRAYEGAYGIIASAGSGKCIKGDSLIITDKGILPIEEIPNHFEVNDTECVTGVYSLDINKNKLIKNNTSNWFNMGHSKTIKLTTKQGYELEGTPEHPIIILNKEGNLEFKELKDIDENDIVAINRNSHVWGNDQTINEEMSYFIGLLIGDGYLADKGGAIKFSKSDPYLRNKYIELIHTLFSEYNLHVKVRDNSTDKRKSHDTSFHNKKLKDKLENIFGLKMTTSEFKEIPQLIMMSPKDVVVKCLQGLFDTDGSFYKEKGIVEYCTKSPIMIRQIQTILLNLGIISKVKKRTTKNYPDTYYYLYISGSNMRLFKDLIGFRYALEKIEKLDSYLSLNKPTNDNVHLFYYQSDRLKRIRKEIVGKSYYDSHRMKIIDQSKNISMNFKDYYTGRRNLTKRSINNLLEVLDFKNADTDYLEFISDNFFFDKISNLEDSESIVYDFTVPDTHSFVSNGFISHNTTVLTSRIKNLIEAHNVPEKDVLAISFTRNTADELKAKLSKMGFSEVNVGTFHSICGRILSQEGIHITGKNLIKEWQIENCFKAIDDKPDVNDIKSFISYQKNYMRGVNDQFVPKESNYREEDLREYYSAYEKFKKKNGLYDFDDYLLECYDILKQNKGKYTYEFILVDEHQDSNLLQNLLLHELCQSGNMFCVYDFRQSLYSFRSGNPEYCMNFDKDWDNATIIHLDINYRSARNIVDNANKFIKRYYKDYRHYSDSIANSKKDGKIKIQTYLTKEEEGVRIADQIEQLISQGEKLNDIAVLYRVNSQSIHIENELKNRNIEYEISGDSSFFKRKEIVGIMSYLRLIQNPHDDAAFEGAFTLRCYPLQFFANKILDDVKRFAGLHDMSYYESFITMSYDKPWQKKNVKIFEDGIEKLRLQKDKHVAVSTLIDNLVKIFGLEDWIKNKYLNKEECEERLNSLSILKSFVKNNNLEQFINYVYSGNTKKKAKKNSVKLMSIHSSKGLEWKTTYLISVEDGKFPHERCDKCEEARIFYVATTRARENLIISQIGEGNQFINEYMEG